MEELFKEHSLYMLKTEDETFIGRDSLTGELCYLEDKPKCLVGYHLYVISDDEIEVEDWCVCLSELDYPEEAIRKWVGTDSCKSCRKIIATTNSVIVSYWGGATRFYYQIPKSFIGEYVNNPVDKVLVEYENVNHMFTTQEIKTRNNEVSLKIK